MKFVSAAAASLLLVTSAGVACAAPAVGNSVVSVDSGCNQADQGINFASTISLASNGSYYLNRTIIVNFGTGTAPVDAPVNELWVITPNSGNTGGTYGVTVAQVSLTGYPISGTYTGAVASAFGGYSFALTLNCGSKVTGLLDYSG